MDHVPDVTGGGGGGDGGGGEPEMCLNIQSLPRCKLSPCRLPIQTGNVVLVNNSCVFCYPYRTHKIHCVGRTQNF
jgi:hypothetical protein